MFQQYVLLLAFLLLLCFVAAPFVETRMIYRPIRPLLALTLHFGVALHWKIGSSTF
jgi:hypothetical protein